MRPDPGSHRIDPEPTDLRAVRSWRRRPLLWLLAVACVGVLFTYDEVGAALHQQSVQGNGRRVMGEVLGSWDGGPAVPVVYRSGGDAQHAIARGPSGAVVEVGPTEIIVDPDDPSKASIAEVEPWSNVIESLLILVPAFVLLLAWWWARRRCLARSRALLAADGPSYAMVAVPRHGRIARRRWTLDLYALDARPGATPVASVPVIAGSRDLMRMEVVVRGTPRAGGHVVARDRHTTWVWWPAGRTLLGSRARLVPEGSHRRVQPRGWTRWILLGLGVACFIYAFDGTDAQVLEERSQSVDVEVVKGRGEGLGPVTVAYTWDGDQHEQVIDRQGPQAVGDRYELRLDPEHPTHLWQPGTEERLPGEEVHSELWFVAAVVFIWLGIVVSREPVGWDAEPLD